MENLIKILEMLNGEFEILDLNGKTIYQTPKYKMVKNNSILLENNIMNLEGKYYDFSRKNIEIDGNEYYINMFNDVTRFENSIIELKEDALTTLPNRYAIDLFLKNSIGNNYITVICDIDDFKKINDTFGHQQGDVVLKEYGKILKYFIKEPNFVGRYGGEEFVMFFKTDELKLVINLLNNIRKAMNNHNDLNNERYCINFSAGITLMNNDKSLTDAIKEADIALYFVKRNGKNANAIYNNDNDMCYIIE